MTARRRLTPVGSVGWAWLALVDEKGAGLGLQLRVYRGVPLVNLNAIAPDKKVEVRPQVCVYASTVRYSI